MITIVLVLLGAYQIYKENSSNKSIVGEFFLS